LGCSRSRYQIILSFGHVHLGNFRHSIARLAVAAAQPVPSDPLQQPIGDADGYCAICARHPVGRDFVAAAGAAAICADCGTAGRALQFYNSDLPLASTRIISIARTSARLIFALLAFRIAAPRQRRFLKTESAHDEALYRISSASHPLS
jgi:hypothetical protein